MKRLAIVVCIAIIALYTGCKRETEFFKLDALTEITLNDKYDGVKILEVYVISNPPRNPYKLKKVVDDYCDKLPKPDGKYYSIRRWFYKETRNTPRDYTEKRKDRLWDHIDDLILKASWVSNKYWKNASEYHFFKNEDLIKNIRVAEKHDGTKEEVELAVPRKW